MAQVSYADVLDAAWQEHLAARAPDAPTVVSTFAGCGGSSLGYSMAGFRELLAVEWDENAVATFKLNFPGVPVYHGDICKLTVEECLRLAGLTGPRKLDVLDGSPPCQGFSVTGKRDLGDDRNQLFREFVRLLRGLQPKVFVMENVAGLVKGKMRLMFAEIMRELKASGYTVSARLLNAMYFDVPQSRERLIFIGTRSDLAIKPSHPQATSNPRCALCSLGDMTDNHNPYGPRNFSMARRHLEHHKPSPTLTKSAVPGADMPFAGNERIADKRAALLSSFPQAFKFAGDWRDAINRIGNSVPPLFMRSIARHVRTELLDG